MQYKFISRYILPFFFWSLILLFIFAHLEDLPIVIWDEARLAVSSYEMYKSGNPILVTYGMSSEMWSVKPPFMLWCQVFFIKLIGYNELAIRLPSALAALGTTALLFRFVQKHTGIIILPFLTVGVLMTTPGYVMIHGTRTGDYDAMLVFFVTMYCLSFYNYLHSREEKFLWWTAIGITLAALTKGVAGLILMPALFAYSIASKNLKSILRSRAFYFGLLGFLLIIGGYYAYRDSIDTGYWNAVKVHELGGRMFNTTDEHKHPFTYYFNLMAHRHYAFWYPFALIGILLGFMEKKSATRNLFIYCVLLVSFHLLVISSSGTKLEWYEMPIYPFLSIIVAMGIDKFYHILDNPNLKKHFFGFSILSFVFVATIFFFAFLGIKDTVFQPQLPESEKEKYNIAYFLKNQLKELSMPAKTYIVNEGYDGQILYFVYAFRERGYSMEIKPKHELENGDVAIVHEKEPEQFIREKYDYEEIRSYENVKLFRILGRKIPTD